MHIIFLNDQKIELSEKAYHQLREVLPYWGLQINDENHVVGRFHGQLINILIKDGPSIEELNQLLFHTSISISSLDNREHDFIIEQHDNDDIMIKASHMTYHLKPSDNHKTGNVQKAIHKKLWLPVRLPHVHIYFPANLDKKKQAEYLIYLIIQYLDQTNLQPISHISLVDYQFLMNKILKSLNLDLFSLQQGDKSFSEWPEPPSMITHKDHATQQNHSLTPTDSPDSLFEYDQVGEQLQIDQEEAKPALGPLARRSNAKKPINPFQNSHSKKSSTPFNPFK